MRDKKLFRGALLAAVFGICALTLHELHAQANPPKAVREVIRANIEGVPGQEIIITDTDWLPGESLPVHIHPGGHEYAYVIQGEMTYETIGQGPKKFKAGEMNHVLPDVPHFGRNESGALVRTIVVRIKDKDKPVSVNVKP